MSIRLNTAAGLLAALGAGGRLLEMSTVNGGIDLKKAGTKG